MDKHHLSKFGQVYISYSNHHYSRINKMIHIFATPLLTASFIAMLNFVPLSLQLGRHTLGLSDITIVLALIYYASLSPAFTAGLALISAGIAIAWQEAFQGIEYSAYVMWVVIIHFMSWIAIIIGHRYFEKRKHPFLENLFDSMAGPLFKVVNLCDMLKIRTPEMEEWRSHIEQNAEALHKKDIQK